VAENDKFERGLTKYWSKAHRLARAKAPVTAIVDEIVSGARRTLEQEAPCRAIRELALLLQHVIDRAPENGQAAFAEWDYRFEYLEIRIDELVGEYEQYPCMRIAGEAARHVFSQHSDASSSAQTIRDALAEEFTARLVEHRWMARVRGRLLDQCNRTIDEQRAWEAELLDLLRPQARRLFNTIFREERVPKRSPARLTHRAEFTLEKLHAPLPGVTEEDSDD
jgi:hypothetical protein